MAGRTNDLHTMEYATFRYDTVEVENGLKSGTTHLDYESKVVLVMLKCVNKKTRLLGTNKQSIRSIKEIDCICHTAWYVSL